MQKLSDLQAVSGDVPDDLSRLPSLEEDRVRDALKQRFDANAIYTHINSLLVLRAPRRVRSCVVARVARACGLCLWDSSLSTTDLSICRRGAGLVSPQVR